MKTNSQYVADARKRAEQAGRIRAQAFMFSARGSELYEKLRPRYESERALLEAGLEALAAAPKPRKGRAA